MGKVGAGNTVGGKLLGIQGLWEAGVQLAGIFFIAVNLGMN